MNVVAGVAMEIHAVPLSALFLEVIKNRNHKCSLSQYQFEKISTMFSLNLKLEGMKISDACHLAINAKKVRTVAAEIAIQ